MKIIGYIVFAIMYKIYSFFVKKDLTFFFLHHDDSDKGNTGRMLKYYQSKNEKIYSLTKKEMRNLIDLIFVKPYYLARAHTIYLDDCLLCLSFVKFSKNVKLVQLWHGTGTIKYFCLDYDKGIIRYLEERVNKKITHLFVSSKNQINQYSKAFGVCKSKIYPLGLPRTETMLELKKIDTNRVLYAPTFLDEMGNKTLFNINLLEELLKPEYELVVRLHPSIKNENNSKNNVYEDIENSSILISDYSSIIIDYALLNKPIYLLQNKKFTRDIYKNLDLPTFDSEEKIVKMIKEGNYDFTKIDKIVRENYDYMDKDICERIYTKVNGSL